MIRYFQNYSLNNIGVFSLLFCYSSCSFYGLKWNPVLAKIVNIIVKGLMSYMFYCWKSHRFLQIKYLNMVNDIRHLIFSWILTRLTLSWRMSHHTEKSPLIRRANQLTGLYMNWVSVMKELNSKKGTSFTIFLLHKGNNHVHAFKFLEMWIVEEQLYKIRFLRCPIKLI